MSLKRLNYVLATVSERVSLRIALILPFVLQLFAIAGLLGYLSWRNGQKAVNDVAVQLRSEIGDRIKQNLDTYLDTPHRLNQSNANAMRLGELNRRNFAQLETHFWHQLALFESVTVVGFANEQRELVAAERQSNQALTIRVSERATGYALRTYTTNQQGDRLKIINVGKNYNPHKRSWYKTPLQTGKQSWSEIYPHITGETLYLVASQPVYDHNGHVEGVLLSNLNLLQIDTFLRSLKIGKTGQSFIVERSGLLVATSTAEAPFQTTTKPVALPEDKVVRLQASDSRDAFTKATANYLKTAFSDFRAIKTKQQLEFTQNHQRQLLQVLLFKDTRGIDWLIVVVIPEADFMERINFNTQTTVLLCLAALIASIIIGILTARWITQPISSVSRSAKALANGQWQQTVNIERSGDLGELARSFNQMAQQIRMFFAEMQSLNEALAQNESRPKQFLEAVPVGIGVVDALGRPYYANQQAVQLLGKGIDPVTSDQIAEVYQLYRVGTDQPYPIENLPVMRTLSGERTRIDDLEIHQNNATIPIEGWGTPIFDELGHIVYAISAFQNITERKRAEQLLAQYNRTLEQQVTKRTAALQESEATLRDREQELRLITDALPICIFYTDLSQRYRFINHACELWFNCSRNEILGRRNHEFLGEAAYQVVEPYIKQALGGQITTYEAELSYPSGNKHISAIYIPDFDRNDQVRGYYGLILDISDRKRAEEASILEERNRMAREIHDTLAQSFTSIIVHLDAASQRLTPDSDAAQSHLKTARMLARSGLADARRSVEALRPQLLEEGDLYSALDRFAAQIFSHTSVQVVCELIGEPQPLSIEVEANLLRIGQEALTNAFKYANASAIRIELRYKQSQCVLQIKDNGKGFESSSLSVGRGFGLLGMTERAERIGAELSIQSHPGQGTDIIVRVQTS